MEEEVQLLEIQRIRAEEERKVQEEHARQVQAQMLIEQAEKERMRKGHF